MNQRQIEEACTALQVPDSLLLTLKAMGYRLEPPVRTELS